MTTVAIVQSAYIPWRGYFELIQRADLFVLYDCVQYTTRDWRNRNRIKTPGGGKWLTIPVHATRAHRICDVFATGDEWREKHWQALTRSYGKAPYFSSFAPQVKALFDQVPSRQLSVINQHFLQGIGAIFGIDTPLHLQLKHEDAFGDRTDRLLAICKRHGATRYLSGPSARGYLDMQRFEREGIRVEWMDYSHYQPYPQLYPPFSQQVTMFDQLFHVGNERQ